MADCYYHGYSGGPGRCIHCDREQQANLEPGTLDGYDQEVTTHDWRHGRIGLIGQPGIPPQPNTPPSR